MKFNKKKNNEINTGSRSKEIIRAHNTELNFLIMIYFGAGLHNRALSLRATLPFNSWSPLIGWASDQSVAAICAGPESWRRPAAHFSALPFQYLLISVVRGCQKSPPHTGANMRISLALFAAFAVGITVDATVFFKEQFQDGGKKLSLAFLHLFRPFTPDA